MSLALLLLILASPSLTPSFLIARFLYCGCPSERKEIREKYQEYRNEKEHEPHFLECVIRWNDTLETLETRIALDMDSDTEMDDEIFFYCDTLDSLLSLADKSGEDFVIAGCFGFGEYEELLQTT